MAAKTDRYGAAAIFGNRALTAREIIGMDFARSIVDNYRSRQAAKNVADWAEENPTARKLLDWAKKLARRND